MKKYGPDNSERKQEIKNEITKTLKSMIFPVILLLIIAVGVYVIVNYQGTEETEEVVVPNAYDGGKDPIVIENDQLAMTFDPTTTHFDIEVKSSGKVWSSNPDGASTDPQALSDEKNKLQSTLLMTYSTQIGLEVSYNNWAYSIENGVYEIESGDDYITVHYSIGDIEKEYIIPPVCTEEEFLYYTDQMDLNTKSTVQEYYKKYDINNLGKKDDKEALLASYPIMETSVIYVLRSTAKENLKKKMQEYFEAAGYTYEKYLEDKELDLSESVSDKAVFNITVTYRLEGDQLVVEVPFSEMEYKSDTPIYTLTVLPYFGAGSTSDEGYMLVPEGGGAVIDFNNGKTSQATYYANLYGWDMCLSRDAVVHNTMAYFNAFGIAGQEDSFLCIIDDATSYASVQADISGKGNSYNYVNAIYSINQREQYDVGEIANSDIYVYTESLPDETIVQRYTFIDSSDYSDMAVVYRDYLLDRYSDTFTANTDSEAPVVVQIEGAVDKVKQVVGVPVSRPLVLTSFAEAEDIITELYDAGLKNMSVKLMGWCNGGENQQLLKSVHILSQLGGKSGLKSLTSKAAELGIDLYLNGVTQYEYNSDIFDGFISYRDAAKFISKERAVQVMYSSVTYSARDGVDDYYLLHTDLALEMAEKLASTAANYNAGVAFEDTGCDLSADYYRKNTNSRDSVRKQQMEQLAEINASGQKIMINMGNDYAAVYSDIITNMDLAGSDYTLLDANVPFYQMAIHGYINYTGEALNICGNTEEELLNCAEYGAGLMFTLMDESAFTLQDTLYTQYYGCDYSVWGEKVIEIYNRYNSEMGAIFDQKMVHHEQITDEVSCTMYEDGTKVYVNYGYIDYETSSGLIIPARDYLVIK